jgi:glyoxylate reductase
MAEMSPTRPRILATRKMMEAVETRLKALFDAHLNHDDHPMPHSELLERAQGCDGLLVTSMDKINAELLGRVPDSVKIIATFSVGYDHIDVNAAKARGIVVTNTPDVLTDATADVAMLLILGAARGAHWGARIVRERPWPAFAPTKPLGLDVSGQRLGIVGMGRIGQALARRARAFDMAIHYHNRTELPPEKTLGAKFHVSVQEMARHCDILSINCASTPETRKMINAEVIAALPDGAIIVNSARGDIIDDDALIAALQSGKLAAAGLDVFRNEPNIDPRFADLPNVFLLPHLGSATPRTRTAMGMRAVDNLEAFFAGKTARDKLT